MTDQHGRDWFKVEIKGFPRKTIQICTLSQHKARPIESLVGFNNTGNICIWSSEECLAKFCLSEIPERLSRRKIIELGGGMTSLAGFTIAKLHDPDFVVVSDGNDISVKNLKLVLKSNRDLHEKMAVKKLRWNEDNQPEDDGAYDVAMASDCVFFEEYRNDLVNKMYSLLKPEGIAIVVAPERNGTLKKFSDIACEKFSIMPGFEEVDFFNSKFLSCQEFKSDIHLPKLLLLKKKGLIKEL